MNKVSVDQVEFINKQTLFTKLEELEKRQYYQGGQVYEIIDELRKFVEKL